MKKDLVQDIEDQTIFDVEMEDWDNEDHRLVFEEIEGDEDSFPTIESVSSDPDFESVLALVLEF